MSAVGMTAPSFPLPRNCDKVINKNLLSLALKSFTQVSIRTCAWLASTLECSGAFCLESNMAAWEKR